MIPCKSTWNHVNYPSSQSIVLTIHTSPVCSHCYLRNDMCTLGENTAFRPTDTDMIIHVSQNTVFYINWPMRKLDLRESIWAVEPAEPIPFHHQHMLSCGVIKKQTKGYVLSQIDTITLLSTGVWVWVWSFFIPQHILHLSNRANVYMWRSKSQQKYNDDSSTGKCRPISWTVNTENTLPLIGQRKIVELV